MDAASLHQTANAAEPQPAPPQPDARKANCNGADTATPEKWLGVLPLRKNVIANGEDVNELKFREPTGGDIERVGCPIILSVFETQPKPIFDGPIMTMMMANLAGVPPSTIRQMDPRDRQNGAMMLFHFFVPDRFLT